MKRILFLSGIFILLSFGSLAQNVAGKVYGLDEKNRKTPLTGVNVYWAHNLQGTTTDSKGFFAIEQEEHNHGDSNEDNHDGHLLVFSFVGYVSDTIHIHQDNRNLEIVLSTISELEGVEVSARQSGSHISRVNPIVTQQINSTELRKAACCNLSESFETNASVDVNYSDAVTGAKQIQLLGLAGIYSQLMIENIPNYYGLANSYGLMWVPGTWMESIQVSKGTAAVINGYESIAGQINVEYKKPNNSEKLFLNLFGDSDGRIESNINAATKLDPNWATMIYGHVSNNSSRDDHNGDGFLDHPLYTQYNFFNRWEYFGKHYEAQFGVQFLDEDRTGGQMNFNQSDDRNADNPYGIGIHNKRWQFFAKNGFLLNRPETSIAMISSYTWHDQETFFGLRDYTARQNSFYNNLIFQSYIGNTQHSFTTGISYIYNDYDEVLSDSAFAMSESVPGVYFQYTYNNPEKFTFIAGMRADFHNIYGTFYTPRVHARYALTPKTVVRASAGKGYRTPNVIAENISFLASSRDLNTLELLKQEEAWNFGTHITQYVDLFGKEMTISADYYRTEFQNQVIVDIDADVRQIRLYNLNGKSYSNSAQLEISYELIKGLDLVAAYRINDVKMTVNEELQRKPLVSKYKGLVTLSYATNMNRWQFDFTSQFNGGGRLPNTSGNPPEYRLEENFPAYTNLNAQITRYFRKWSIYAGGENLLNYTQHHPIVAANDPFGDYFDASMVWGPIMGSKYYVGLRFAIE
ncbi:MAG: TonB-dependent receptor [Bacteroidales bacterium]|nr:TonB-dependent receptor [Bacteroidales bacterium]